MSKNIRILIVDDERSIRMVLKNLLSRFGHEVQCVECGEKALEVLKAPGIDLVISDIIMPGMSGIELTQEIRTKYPQIKILLMSGTSADSTSAKLPINGFLTKPFTASEVQGVVVKSLE